MSILISLVGEQPIPVLLPAVQLKPDQHVLVCSAETEPVAKRLQKFGEGWQVKLLKSPYNLEAMITALHEIAVGEDLFFNLTGGTKLMSLAMYRVAMETRSRFGYLESQNHRSDFYVYAVQGDSILSEPVMEISESLSIDQYLQAHLDDYEETGISQTEGGRLEQWVKAALEKAGFETKAGVRPAKAGGQLEIDLVVRKNNQVGIVEIKSGDKKGESSKKGIDQLTTAGAREYLGTYTARFLVVARGQERYIKELAQAQRVNLIEIPHYDAVREKSESDREKLVDLVSDTLLGRKRR